MSRVDIPNQDTFYGPWIINFASVATANITALNITSGQATTLTSLATAFQNAYEDSEAAKVTAKSKVATKDSFREASETAFRSMAKVINANPNISSGLKADLGITISPSMLGPVVIPNELTAEGSSIGVNMLKWNRNGNSQGTTFMIEAKLGEAGTWNVIAITSRTSYRHSGQVPGQMITYRVSAQRDDVQSPPSGVFVLYPVSEVEVFTLKEAA